MIMTDQERLDFDRLNSYIAEGRLIRGSWTGTDAQSRETACLLAALSSDVRDKRSAAACPAALMRPWLAHLTVWIDDNGTLEKWPEHVMRYAAVIPKVAALDAAADDRLSRRIRVIIVKEAVSHVTVDKWGVKAACEQTIVALESGDKDKIAAAFAALAFAAADAAFAARAAARAAEAAEVAEAAEAAAGSAARGKFWRDAAAELLRLRRGSK